MRRLATSLAWLGLAGAACGAPWAGRTEPLAVGDPAPARWTARASDAGAPLLVVWSLRGADVVVCASAAREIRHAQAAFADRVTFMALTPAADSVLVASFLRTERLGGLPRRPLAEREFREDTGGESAPTIYVVRRGEVVARLPADRQAILSGRGADRLELILTALLAQPG
jgi:hypothetical protein